MAPEDRGGGQGVASGGFGRGCQKWTSKQESSIVSSRSNSQHQRNAPSSNAQAWLTVYSSPFQAATRTSRGKTPPAFSSSRDSHPASLAVMTIGREQAEQKPFAFSSPISAALQSPQISNISIIFIPSRFPDDPQWRCLGFDVVQAVWAFASSARAFS